MTSEQNQPVPPPTLREAVTERQVLRDQLLSDSKSFLRRYQDLAARVKEITKAFGLDKPHVAETKEEFLGLHKSFLDLAKETKDSQDLSSALMREIPSSKSSWQFIKNRTTPTKALQHEQRVVGALRHEFDHGMKERDGLVDRMREVVDKMQALADAEPAT
jgi:hypothetical protein